MLYAVLFVSAFFWPAHPTLQSLISRDIPADKQGELQGALMSLTSLTSIVNPLMMTSLFAVVSRRESSFYFPGAPYLAAAALFFLAWVFIYRWTRNASDISR
jgi:DHA1 family tetracycline resistance protein-like MFS transporter